MENQTVETVKFGIGQIGNHTPEWARWGFRIFFYCTSLVGIFLTIFTRIPDELKLDILQGTTFANLAAHGLSKMFGVTEEPTDFFQKS